MEFCGVGPARGKRVGVPLDPGNSGRDGQCFGRGGCGGHQTTSGTKTHCLFRLDPMLMVGRGGRGRGQGHCYTQSKLSQDVGSLSSKYVNLVKTDGQLNQKLVRIDN